MILTKTCKWEYTHLSRGRGTGQLTTRYQVTNMMQRRDRPLFQDSSTLQSFGFGPGEMQNGYIEEQPITPPKVCYIYDTRMMQHECMSDFHPEQPLRISSIFAKLEEAGCIQRMLHIPCREALQEEVTLVHTKKLWDTVEDFQSASHLFFFRFRRIPAIRS